MTHLRKIMLEELQRRNYAETAIANYLRAVQGFAKYFGKPPDRLNHDHLREYQAYLLRDRKVEPRTVKLHVSALRFFFVKTLKRRYLLDDFPFPKVPRRLPVILTVEEVGRLINSASNLMDRTLLMVLYATGMRDRELRNLQVKDLDGKAMLILIQHGKGGHDRYVPLSPKLLETLREYWRWMKPKTWLFPGMVDGWRADKPITPKVVWDACQSAAQRAGIEERVSAHLLRHYVPFLTMSSNREPVQTWPGEFRSPWARPLTLPDMVLGRLQIAQEGEESVTRFIAPPSSLRWGGLRQRFLLHGQRRLEIDLRGFNTFVTQPQRDHRTVDAPL